MRLQTLHVCAATFVRASKKVNDNFSITFGRNSCTAQTFLGANRIDGSCCLWLLARSSLTLQSIDCLNSTGMPKAIELTVHTRLTTASTMLMYPSLELGLPACRHSTPTKLLSPEPEAAQKSTATATIFVSRTILDLPANVANVKDSGLTAEIW